MTPLRGAAYLWRGLRLLTQPGVRLYAVGPVTINAILFTALTVLLSTRLDRWIDALVPALPPWLTWLHWLVWAVAAAAALLLSFFAVSLAANLIASPFNEILAARVERHLTGAAPPEASKPWTAVIAGAVANELRKLVYFVLRAVPLLLLYVIPGVNAAAPFLWLIFSAWMLALEYTDFPMGNHDLPFAAQRRLLAGDRLAVLGFGGAVLLLTAVPVVNLIVMPAAVAGATALWAERLKPGSGHTAAAFTAARD